MRVGVGVGRHLGWSVVALVGLCVAGGTGSLPGPMSLAAQAAQAGQDEVELLREAGVKEAMGDLAGAESLLNTILETRPASVPALLALERVLKVQARLDDLVPRVRAALEEDGRSALLNQLLIRTYSMLDRVRDLEAASNAWIETVPNIEIPYREIARVWESRGDLNRARSVLERGRAQIGRPDALALELGDLYAALDHPERAVIEWERAVGTEARGLNQVRRRLRSLPDGGAELLPRLVAMLVAEPTTPARLQAAVDLGLDGGLEDAVLEAAPRALVGLEPGADELFLVEIARRADGARLYRVARWAYTWLAEAEEQEGRALAIRNRLAELALEMGDTAAAAASYEAVESAYEPGTPQRRQAAALRIELMASQEVDEAVEALQAFRVEYMDAPELDRLAAAVGGALVRDGRRDQAELLLRGVRGPRSGMLRGRIALERGQVDEARLAYMGAAPGLRGAEATRVLSLVTLLGRVSPRAATLLGQAMRLQDSEEPGAALDTLVAGTALLVRDDRPPLLEFAAALADAAGLVADARKVRRRLVEDHPRSNEAPNALLELARSLRHEEGGRVEARELLERLIIEYPRSALVPQARRELQQLTRNVTADGPMESRT